MKTDNLKETLKQKVTLDMPSMYQEENIYQSQLNNPLYFDNMNTPNHDYNMDTSMVSMEENINGKAAFHTVLPNTQANTETIDAMNSVPQLEITVNEAKNRIIQLQEFIRFMMVPNVDYGFIPNCPKPTLLKPGAEKLCDVYGFSKQIEISNRTEDFDRGIFHYEVKAILVNKRTGLVEAEGIGCCNNKEKKFISQDPFSIMNTILKMAKKRALVDAVLSATRTSGIFAQDLEGMGGK